MADRIRIETGKKGTHPGRAGSKGVMVNFLVFSFLVVFLVLILNIAGNCGGQAYPGPMDHAEDAEIDISPTGIDIGSSTLQIHNSASDSTVRVRVSLDLDGYRTDLNRSVSIQPSSIETIPFTIIANRTYPPNETIGLIFVDVTHVNGIPAHGSSGTTVSFRVTTTRVQAIEFDNLPGVSEIGPNEETEIPFTVTNVGNLKERFRLDVVDQKRMAADGIEVVLKNITTRELEPGESQEIFLRVSTSDTTNVIDRYHSIEIVATGNYEGNAVSGTFLLHHHGIGIKTKDSGPVIVLFAIFLCDRILFTKKKNRSNTPMKKNRVLNVEKLELPSTGTKDVSEKRKEAVGGDETGRSKETAEMGTETADRRGIENVLDNGTVEISEESTTGNPRQSDPSDPPT